MFDCHLVLYAVFPFTDRNNLRHYRMIDVPMRNARAQKTSGDEGGVFAIRETANFALNFDASAKMFSDEMYACVVHGVYDPPGNLTPRMFISSPSLLFLLSLYHLKLLNNNSSFYSCWCFVCNYSKYHLGFLHSRYLFSLSPPLFLNSRSPPLNNYYTGILCTAIMG